jgi:hypothetical protein
MSEVILFVTGQSNVFENQNRVLKQHVESFCNWMFGKDFSIVEYCRGEDYQSIFDKNKDCKLVFALSTDTLSMYEATKRQKLVFECQSEKTFWPVKVTRINHRGYKKIPYGI